MNLSLVTNTKACQEGPCPYCVLGVQHDANMDDAAYAYRVEWQRFIETNENPWRYWMRSVAWNQLYVRHLISIMPLQPGPWDEDTRGSDPPGGLYPNVPVGMVPTLTDSWVSCCGVRPPPPPPPEQFGSGASASSAAVHHSAQESNVELFRWQYTGGKKGKWTDYEDEATTQLEHAFQMGWNVCDLRIEDWDYRINFRKMTQISMETGTVRSVRRLCPMDE
jgi:hypothetical protein